MTACPYAPQNLEINTHIPDRLQGVERERGEENSLQNIQNATGEALGRGNRRRKKRKFFDEDRQEGEPGSKMMVDGEEEGDEESRTNSPSNSLNGSLPGRILSGRRSNSLETNQRQTRNSTELKVSWINCLLALFCC